MKCPKCWKTEMEKSTHKGIEIDRCPDCKGIYFDVGELEAIIEKSIGAKIEDLPRIRIGSGKQDKKSAYCFRCDNEMSTIEEPGKVRFDMCEKCNAIFLDSGELTDMQNK
ncbi:MAG: zf-TFIIB domain-containing protein [Deltaproteobacteria bacterium]|nr:zf-TFIIB domain-containing protein [Deltaproteobacteria bacterium]